MGWRVCISDYKSETVRFGIGFAELTFANPEQRFVSLDIRDLQSKVAAKRFGQKLPKTPVCQNHDSQDCRINMIEKRAIKAILESCESWFGQKTTTCNFEPVTFNSYLVNRTSK
jgi:hypothetical protein